MAVELNRNLSAGVRIALEGSPTTPELMVVAGREIPQLGAGCIILQPDVLVNDPRRGWMPVGGTYPELAKVDPEYTPWFDLGDGYKLDQIDIWCGPDRIVVSNASDSAAAITARASDFR